MIANPARLLATSAAGVTTERVWYDAHNVCDRCLRAGFEGKGLIMELVRQNRARNARTALPREPRHGGTRLTGIATQTAPRRGVAGPWMVPYQSRYDHAGAR